MSPAQNSTTGRSLAAAAGSFNRPERMTGPLVVPEKVGAKRLRTDVRRVLRDDVVAASQRFAPCRAGLWCLITGTVETCGALHSA